MLMAANACQHTERPHSNPDEQRAHREIVSELLLSNVIAVDDNGDDPQKKGREPANEQKSDIEEEEEERPRDLAEEEHKKFPKHTDALDGVGK
jgi:hypothetical protein